MPSPAFQMGECMDLTPWPWVDRDRGEDPALDFGVTELNL